MIRRIVHDSKTPVGDILDAAQTTGVLLETAGKTQFAMLLLDDDLLDYLLERSPSFAAECQAIRGRMQAGAQHSHSDLRKMFTQD